MPVVVRQFSGEVLSSTASFLALTFADWGTEVSGSGRFDVAGEREVFLKVTESQLLPVSRRTLERVRFLSENWPVYSLQEVSGCCCRALAALVRTYGY